MPRGCSLGALLRELGGWQAEVDELFTGWHSPGRTGGICLVRLVGLFSERPQAGSAAAPVLPHGTHHPIPQPCSWKTGSLSCLLPSPQHP